MSDPTPKPSPGLQRGERRRWGVFSVAVVLIAYLVWLFLSESATNAKSDRALRDDKATVTRLTAVAAQASAAAAQAQHAVDCINATLAARSGTTAADNQAHIEFSEALLTVLTTSPSATASQQKAAVTKFIEALGAYVHTLVVDQEYRDNHPLGRC